MKKTKGLFVALFLVILGISFTIRAITLGVGTIKGPQCGFFPFFSGLTFSILSSILLIQEWRGQSIEEQSFGKLGRPFILIIGMVIYTLILGFLGYTISTTLLAATLLWGLEWRDWRTLLVTSLAIAAGSYIVFDRLLGVELPSGIVENLWEVARGLL